jgi:hypothetical protein
VEWGELANYRKLLGGGCMLHSIRSHFALSPGSILLPLASWMNRAMGWEGSGKGRGGHAGGGVLRQAEGCSACESSFRWLAGYCSWLRVGCCLQSVGTSNNEWVFCGLPLW